MKKLFRYILSLDLFFFIFNFFYKLFFFFFKRGQKLEIERRSNLSIFDYKELAKRVNYRYYIIYDNNLYGAGNIIFNHFGISKYKRERIFLEHGVYFATSFYEREKYSSPFYREIYTFSNFRKNRIEKHIKKKVTLLGPYIKYTRPLLSQKTFLNLKKELGKVLLVFPSHSIDTFHATFDEEPFISYIESIKGNFDSVLICLYWKDIEMGRDTIYLEKNYQIVTAGYNEDYNFLSRLRSIIELADFTISNSLGTHLGYCICLNKPHAIFNSEISRDDNVFVDNNKFEKTSTSSSEWLEYDKIVDDFKKVFSTNSSEITNEQKEMVRKYWGDF